MRARVHRHRRYRSESGQGSQAVMKPTTSITCWCGQHHRNTYADPERQGTHALIHCPDDGVRLLRHAALALCLAPGPLREMRSVSAERSKADMRRGFRNDRAAKIAVVRFKPAIFKAKL
jgi:hypothetical protein